MVRRHPTFIMLVLFLLPLSIAEAQQVLQPADLVAGVEAEEARRYSVELIIFEYNDTSMSGTEVFLPEELPPEDDQLLREFDQDADGRYFGDLSRQADVTPDLGSGEDGQPVNPPFSPDELILDEIPSSQQLGLRVMQPDEFTLNNIYDKLEQLGAYKPLMRTAWVQETVAEEETRPIKLRRLGDPPINLDGNVTLYLGRYLHLVLDIALEEPAPQSSLNTLNRGDDNSDAGYRGNRAQPASDYDAYSVGGNMGSPRRSGSIFYRIQEDRIVRNGELRYYDHPRFGAIAKITRIEESRPLPGEFAPGNTTEPGVVNQGTP